MPPSEPIWKKPGTVLITGATGGIGAALALAYAQPGRTLILHGRDRPRLTSLAQNCQKRGAQVAEVTFDLHDSRTAEEMIRDISERHTIDLAVANAGITRMIGNGETAESLDTAREVLAVNLEGALATIAGVLPAMKRRNGGQIAIMSSLAAYYGIARTPAYCASKAALKVYGESLRAQLRPHGIAVNVILPGYVDTPMTDSLRGPKPSVLPPEKAALLIQRGLEHNRARIAFPRHLAWGMPWLAVLPAPIAERIMGSLGFGGRKST